MSDSIERRALYDTYEHCELSNRRCICSWVNLTKASYCSLSFCVKILSYCSRMLCSRSLSMRSHIWFTWFIENKGMSLWLRGDSLDAATWLWVIEPVLDDGECWWWDLFSCGSELAEVVVVVVAAMVSWRRRIRRLASSRILIIIGLVAWFSSPLVDVLLRKAEEEAVELEEDKGDILCTDDEEEVDEKLYGTDLKTLVVLSELASMMTGLWVVKYECEVVAEFGITVVTMDVDMVVVNGRRRLVVRGRSNSPPLERFWPPAFNGAVMVVQQAITVYE